MLQLFTSLFNGRARIGRVLAAGLLLMLFSGSAQAEGISLQAANDVVAASPENVRVTFDAPPDLATTHVNVFTVNHEPVEIGPLQRTADPRTISADLPTLTPGLYTVAWESATPGGPNHSTSGAFAFQFNDAQASPRVLVQPQPQFALPTLDRVVPRWLVYTAILTAIGSLLLRLFVWSPVLRKVGASKQAQPTWRSKVEQRLSQVTAAAMLLIIPASLLQAAWEGANAAKHPLFTDGFNPGAFATYLTSPGAGAMWSVRLALIALASINFVAGVMPLRGRVLSMRARFAGGLLAASLALYATELLVRTAPGDLTVDTGRTVTNWLLDWSHLVGAAVWVGGLIGLAVTASLLRPSRGAPPHAARSVIRGFSNLAVVCVGVLTISGTWEAWLHIGSPDMLLTTLYGRTLLLKLAVVAVLLGLGAINLLHVLPRLEAAQRLDPDRPSLILAALRHFRKVVILEALLGLVVLAIVPFLSGSARSQDAHLRSANLTQTAVIGNTTVALTPSALQPGLVDYYITLPASFNDRVALVFDSPDLGVPANEVVATARGNGTYRATGLLTPIIGQWRVQVHLGDDAAQQMATFALPVKAQPVAPPPNQAPAFDSRTLALGLIEILAVVASLFIASRLSTALSSMPLARPGRRVAR